VTPNPVIVALDVASAEDALRLARLVAPAVGGFKIGLGLLMGPGPGVTKAIASLGRPVFVDAKLHDIPSTVSRASEQLGRLGVRWVTAHGMGGAAMLEAAVAGLQAGSRAAEAGVLAVTVLTMLVSPFLVSSAHALSMKLTRRIAEPSSRTASSSVSDEGRRTSTYMCPPLRSLNACLYALVIASVTSNPSGTAISRSAPLRPLRFEPSPWRPRSAA